MGDLPLLDIRTRRGWRAWLAKHHASSAGIWLVRHKPHSGVTSMPYEDVVREALCFGWIDSLIRRLDADRYAIKVTPRKPSSKWSDSNRARWAELKKAGELAPAGLAAAPTDARYAPKPVIPELPDYVEQAFRRNTTAWAFFERLPRTARRQFVAWIHLAKQKQTRARRIQASIALLAKGRRLGLK